MATLTQRRSENVTGDFYVDSTCIDCDTCRWMSPTVFSRVGTQSAVSHQPNHAGERRAAIQALLSCPTASIGTIERPTDVKATQATLPIPITATVYHCGYHSEKSFGAASYFIQRDGGNVLVDSPRFTPPLVQQLEAMGGIRYLYLTHRDDVADHAKFQQYFGCDRLLHQDDITPDTANIEQVLQGTEAIALTPDLLIIPVPGHTKGHTVLLYTPPNASSILFTGDHLAWSEPLQHLHGFRRHCWYSWPIQIESMKTLLNYDFEWVLPGHGRRYQGDRPTMHHQLQHCIDWMKTQP
ncbi:MAG: MBL fold metallo-hydrolase [Leptolyngbyaceae bacterium]|nr:MBL fold metallo-hydrolase [Leptolyngbyaceae bacterium]